MTPELAKLKAAVDEGIDDLNRIGCTLEILLEALYADENSSPANEALTLLWKNITSVKERLCSVCMNADLWGAVAREQKSEVERIRKSMEIMRFAEVYGDF